MTIVRTVLGDIAHDELGVTYAHEHLVIAGGRPVQLFEDFLLADVDKALDVLEGVDYVPRRYEVARLPGYDIKVGPLANLVRSDQHAVYGIVATGTHDELARLYDHAENVLGGRYLPEPVLVVTESGHWLPALTYIAHSLAEGPVADDYLDRIVGPARAHDFPQWYIDRLESFRA